MLTKTKIRKIKEPQVIYKGNKPVSVIIDIDEYKEILERLDDIEDINYLEGLKNKSLKFRKLNDFLNEIN